MLLYPLFHSWGAEWGIATLHFYDAPRLEHLSTRSQSRVLQARPGFRAKGTWAEFSPDFWGAGRNKQLFAQIFPVRSLVDKHSDAKKYMFQELFLSSEPICYLQDNWSQSELQELIAFLCLNEWKTLYIYMYIFKSRDHRDLQDQRLSNSVTWLFSKKDLPVILPWTKTSCKKPKDVTALRESYFVVGFFFSSISFCLTNTLRGSQTTIDLHLCNPDFLILNYEGLTLHKQQLP